MYKKDKFNPTIEEKIRNGKNLWLSECMEAMDTLADKENLSGGQVIKRMIDSVRKRCTYNFGGCNDIHGEHLAFDLEEIAHALNVDRDDITCDMVCDHGCCAYINKILYGTFIEAVEGNPEVFKALTSKENENK